MNEPAALRAAVRHVGAAAVVDLHGEIDAFSDAPLQEAWTLALASKPERVLLNLTGVDYINSTGIALLVALLAHAQRIGVTLLVCGLSAHYVEIFRITRLSAFIPTFATEEEALASAFQAGRLEPRAPQ